MGKRGGMSHFGKKHCGYCGSDFLISEIIIIHVSATEFTPAYDRKHCPDCNRIMRSRPRGISRRNRIVARI